MQNSSVCILGCNISSASINDAVRFALAGGLILAPSAPGLCNLETDSHYREALLNADLNLPDSGLAILMARILGLGTLPRTSGLGFLQALLRNPKLAVPHSTFWVMPSWNSLVRNLIWLNSQGVPVEEMNCYVAPHYPSSGPVQDDTLFSLLLDTKPEFIFICTGSGNQEKLGLWLKQNLPNRPTICCIGAAISFLTGDQIRIPSWADRFCLGWLFRCLAEPPKFIPRYTKALKLVCLIFKYRDKAPVIQAY